MGFRNLVNDIRALGRKDEYFDVYFNKVTEEQLLECLAELLAKRRGREHAVRNIEILKCRYGIGGFYKTTYAKIGEYFDLSGGRTREIVLTLVRLIRVHYTREFMEHKKRRGKHL